MNAEMERRMVGLIGLGVRARNVVVGVEQVRVAARKGRLALAVVAADASPHSRDKVLPLLAAKRVKVIEIPRAATLGAATGRDTTAAVGVLDAALARGIRDAAGQAGRRTTDTERHSRADGNGPGTESSVARAPSPVRS
jgi:ribosomal protein L7Ae-like RNA K-turn-binding protein